MHIKFQKWWTKTHKYWQTTQNKAIPWYKDPARERQATAQRVRGRWEEKHREKNRIVLNKVHKQRRSVRTSPQWRFVRILNGYFHIFCTNVVVGIIWLKSRKCEAYRLCGQFFMLRMQMVFSSLCLVRIALSGESRFICACVCFFNICIWLLLRLIGAPNCETLVDRALCTCWFGCFSLYFIWFVKPFFPDFILTSVRNSFKTASEKKYTHTMFNWMMTDWLNIICFKWQFRKTHISQIIRDSDISSCRWEPRCSCMQCTAQGTQRIYMKLLENHRMHCCISN